MSEIKIETKFGEVTVKDAMLDGDSKCLVEGVCISLGGEFICELQGYSTESITENISVIEEVINEFLG